MIGNVRVKIMDELAYLSSLDILGQNCCHTRQKLMALANHKDNEKV